MNTSHISKYAPKARRDFIQAVTQQAAKYGVTAKGITALRQEGDLALVDGRPFPDSIIPSRRALESSVKQNGFQQVMEKAAYSWFNRLCAIRFMELKGYLDHGRRVLSHPDKTSGFQILDDVLDIELPGLDSNQVRELKLDGTKDEELYREILLAQCHALHQAMPFLFEAIDDETELLLPENLTKTDSLIRDLVDSIPEADWDNIEIIGWLYQFYISEKKDQVIGKVVASEDIPAATQLFTPNWIVKYMVQNSLGAQWLATYPDSPLKAQMEYYIEPAEQTDEVNTQLKAITPNSLNPEELTLIDPASGSGHILVEAYDLFRAIYLERGYRQRDVPQLILEKNLFGLDIDERAAQLTGFALMMKGRADDRRLFERGVKLNVMALVDSAGFDAEVLAPLLRHSRADSKDGGGRATQDAKAEGGNPDNELQPSDLTELKWLFEHATTFGSLIQVPEGLGGKLPALKQLSEATSQDLFVSEARKRLEPLVQQAELLAAQYDAVVANPPYMGSKYYCSMLKDLINATYKAGKADLYGSFTLRNITLAKISGHVGMITIPNWMFLSSFEQLRHAIFQEAPVASLCHNGRGVWGSDFGSCSYVLQKASPQGLSGRFLRLFDNPGSVANNNELERRFHTNPRFTIYNSEFSKIPGSPLAYWVGHSIFELFEKAQKMRSVGVAKKGLTTGNNERFLLKWAETNLSQTAIGTENEEGLRYFPHLKGGDFRKWYGNHEYVLKYDLQSMSEMAKGAGFRRDGIKFFFRAGVSWSDVTIGTFSARLLPKGHFTFNNAAPSAFYDDEQFVWVALGLVNSSFIQTITKVLNPSVHFNPGNYDGLPLPLNRDESEISAGVRQLVDLSKEDWDAYERSWDFQSLPILTACSDPNPTLESSYTVWITQNKGTIAEMKRLEEENNRLFIDAYGLVDELTPDVPLAQITLTVNPAYRYGGKLTDEEQWNRFRQDTLEELVSYAIGCMMGRYSLDAPGLIYAHSGNEGFDPSQYTTFPADDDGIIPLTDIEWFADDACNRVVEFIAVAWDKKQLEENLAFLADNLAPKKNESSRDTIRRYLSAKFFKDHLKTYKKRPIYWLFSSGKQKAFECLVYLHRYNQGTLARMRTEYVIPLTAKLSTYVEKLEKDKEASSSTAETKRLEKQIEKIHKQQAELSTYDEKLRHHADQRIILDLDDGVKVNYGKFGDLLAEVKVVTGSVAILTY